MRPVQLGVDQKGVFLFSVEKQDTGFALTLDARFQQSLSHIQHALPVDMRIRKTQEEALRQNAEKWVSGLLCLIEKN